MRASEQYLPQKGFSKFLLHIKIKGGFLKLESTLITFVSKFTLAQASLLSCQSMHFLVACANSVVLSMCLDLCLFLPLLLACSRYRLFSLSLPTKNHQFNICAPWRWEMMGAKHSALEMQVPLKT